MQVTITEAHVSKALEQSSAPLFTDLSECCPIWQALIETNLFYNVSVGFGNDVYNARCDNEEGTFQVIRFRPDHPFFAVANWFDKKLMNQVVPKPTFPVTAEVEVETEYSRRVGAREWLEE